MEQYFKTIEKRRKSKMKEVLAVMNRYNSFHKAIRDSQKGIQQKIASHSGSGSSFAHCYGGK